MRKYEALYILRTDSSEPDVEELHEKLKGVITSFGGVELRFENWGKRKLAYEMKKNPKGVFFYHLYLGAGDVVQEIQRHLRVSDLVVKFQTTVLEDGVELSDEQIEQLQSTPSAIFVAIQDERKYVSERTSRSDDDDDDDRDDDDHDDDDERPRRPRHVEDHDDDDDDVDDDERDDVRA
ncbi:MAG: 30S ribosomal protein S6 [Myxococcales bacterium]|nr:30S ribosomal protein S6 [Myxococcales bacterium]